MNEVELWKVVVVAIAYLGLVPAAFVYIGMVVERGREHRRWLSRMTRLNKKYQAAELRARKVGAHTNEIITGERA